MPSPTSPEKTNWLRILILVLVSASAIQAQNTYTVNTTTDAPDNNVGDGICNSGSGDCSLRAALEEANASPLKDVILFSISGAGPHRIVATTAFPFIQQPITINGTSQPGYVPGTPQIMVDGNALAGVSGFVFESNASNSEISGLSIGRFVNSIVARAQNVVITANLIGVEPDGTTLMSNSNAGIFIDNTSLVTIGGNVSASRNVISGHAALNTKGIYLLNASNNYIAGNYIGLAPDGLTTLANRHGIVLEGISTDNHIGGLLTAEANYISGNTIAGILIGGASGTNTIEGNIIGLNTNGDSRPNINGVVVNSTGTENRIGSSDLLRRNIISGNSTAGSAGIYLQSTDNHIIGNYIGTDIAGTLGRSNWYGIHLSGTATGTQITDNIISANVSGIRMLVGADNTRIQRNKIGTDVTGTLSLGNSASGLHIFSANNIIGGTAADGNLISSNGDGLMLQGASQNIIRGNLIGVDVSGNLPLGNSRGFYLLNASNNDIGGLLPEHRNTISANVVQGILMLGTCLTNTIQGNYIGLGADGITALKNNVGIELGGSSANNQIGGTFGIATNYMSSNARGLYLSTSGSDNVVEGNVFGLNINQDITGNSDGIWWTGSGVNQRIGGTTPASRNIFSGSTAYGIEVFGGNNSTIVGNYFGTDFNGTAARANHAGIILLNAISNHIRVENNVISGHTTNGVELWNGATENTLINNKIGTDITGMLAIPNGSGIQINGTTTSLNVIGGNSSEGNLISGNTNHGINFTGGARDTYVTANQIGTTIDGNPLPNGGYGIQLDHNVNNNFIGGSSAAEGNTIAFNTLGGIRMFSTIFNFPEQNRVTKNSIYANGNIGIVLATTGPNKNDVIDADDGSNKLQNYPIISKNLTVNIATSQLTLEYFVPSDPAHSVYPITVEFFIDDGTRQGRTHFYTDSFTEADYQAHTPKTLTIDVSGFGFNSTDLPVATATDANGNTSEFGFIVPNAPNIVPTVACGDQAVELIATGAVAGETYQWFTNVSDVTPIATGASFTTPVITANTTYYASVIDAGINESIRIAIPVLYVAPPGAPTITPLSPTEFCEGGNAMLSAPTGFSAYLWSSGETTEQITVASAGNYTVSVADVNGCSSPQSPGITITVNPLPPQPVVTALGSTEFCEGDDVTLAAPSGFSGYNWTTGETTEQITVNTAGSYSVSVTDVNGCISPASAGTSVTVNPLPSAPIITALGPIIFCENGSVVLAAPSGFVTYTWSTGETTEQITVTESGSYQVSVTNSNTCVSPLSGEVVVTEVPEPCNNQPPVIALLPITLQAGETFTINLWELITDTDNNLDLTTLTVLQSPESGATVTLIDGVLTLSYSGVSFAGEELIVIQVCDVFGECAQQTFVIEVIGELIVYNALSPNSDGKNDRFIIEHIDKIPDTQQNTVSIFNRWGDLVWEGSNYDNETVSFMGKSNNNHDLPSGTYFYKVNFKGKYEPLAGYLSIKR